MDNGRYTCHIRGLYILAQTTDTARQVASLNANSNASDDNLLYPDDLFSIQVRSQSIRPALFYIEQVYGDGSVFSSYAITAAGFLFNISNANGKFGRTLTHNPLDPYLLSLFSAFTINNTLSLTDNLAANLDFDYITPANSSNQFNYRVKQASVPLLNTSVLQLTLALWSGK